LLIFLASEEKKPGKRYFVLIQNIVLTFIITSLLFFYGLNMYVVVIISVIVYLLTRYIKNPKRTYAVYPLIGIFFYIVWADKIFLIILASLTFVYGLVTAFLQVSVKEKKSISRVLFKHSTFLVTALLPLLISYF